MSRTSGVAHSRHRFNRATPPGGQDPEVSPFTISFTGASYDWTVPPGVTTVTVDAYGAEGGPNSSPFHGGGHGGRVECDVAVTPAEVLRVFVGGRPTGTTGGFNGGGNGGVDGGAGGGATDIRRSPYALADRLVVAGGGGGTGGNDNKDNSAAGTGGTPNGGAGADSDFSGGTGGGGGTNAAGGAAGVGPTNGVAGALGTGGAGANPGSRGGGGGGGGNYGGGGGACGNTGGTSGAGGGGGSGLSTGTNETLQSGVRTGHGEMTLTW